jgi:hypothetical protein
MSAYPPTEHRTDADAEAAPPVPAGVPGDRRRPGRLERVSPALVGLLRADPKADFLRDDTGDGGDALRPMRGILLWSVLGLLVWAVLFWSVWGMLR